MRLRHAIAAIAAVTALALPSAAAAKGGAPVDKLAAQHCAQERHDVGRKAFSKRYGSKHQMRSCIRRSRGKVGAAAETANSDCQAELAAVGPAEFTDLYADDPGDLSEAMDECVAEGVDEILDPEDDVDDESEDDGAE